MKRLLLIVIVGIYSAMLSATNYTVAAGKSIRIDCTASAPAGYITSVHFGLVNSSDAEYIGISYNSSDGFATIYGYQAKQNIPIEVYYIYTYVGSYDNRTHVGHGTYYDYITVTGSTSPTKIELKASNTNPSIGETITITPTFTPANTACSLEWTTAVGYWGDFEWEFDGLKAYLTPKKSGTYAIVALNQNNNNVYGAIAITVKKSDPENVTISETLDVYIGETSTIRTNFYPNNSSSTCTWYPKDSKVLAISNRGVVTGLTEGTERVYCETENGLVSNECVVNVLYREIEDIAISKDTLILPVNGVEKLTYTISPSNAKDCVKWKVDDGGENVIMVSDNGYVLGLKSGQAYVVAEAENNLASACFVNVLPELTKLELQDVLELTLGETFKIIPSCYPSNPYLDLAWTTDDQSIASVDNEGNVIANACGTTKITVRNSNGVAAECMLYVKDIKFVNVWTKSGELSSYALSKYPKISYVNDEKILIQSDDEEIEYDISNIEKISIADEFEPFIPTGIDVPYKNAEQMTYKRGIFALFGSSPNSIIRVYNIDGKILYMYETDQNGVVSIDCSQFGRGVYVIKTNNESYKISIR